MLDEGRRRAYHQVYALGQALALLTAAGDVLGHAGDNLSTTYSRPSAWGVRGQPAGAPAAESVTSSLGTLQRRYTPELLAETLHIADRCHFSLAQLRYEYPEELVLRGRRQNVPSEPHLRGAAQRWPAAFPTA